MSNDGVGMTVANAVFGLQELNHFHVLLNPSLGQDSLPMRDGLAIVGLDRREV
jgi:hypothetical protein